MTPPCTHCFIVFLVTLTWTLLVLPPLCGGIPELRPASPPAARDAGACSVATDCSSCIGRHGCIWCVPDDIALSDARCMEASKRVNCSGEAQDPRGKVILGDPSTDVPYSIALIPSQATVKLRVGQPQQVKLKLDVSTNQWLDLYYLTDISMSMKDDLEFLKAMGKSLEEKMMNLTNMFNIGFGTFIDKKMLPYYDEYSHQSPAVASECYKSYSFCNALPLTETGGDDDSFGKAVSEAAVADNKDAPEGGLDALLQVLVCTDAIKWRQQARKMVLYASDNAFHYAGDGKLAGIYDSNDGECHMDPRNQYYTKSKEQDYPSVAQIGAAAKANDISVIFAVVKNMVHLYELLKEHVPGSQAVEILEDSSNIISIIEDTFLKISTTASLTASPLDGLVDVSFRYDCPQGGPYSCEALAAGTTGYVTVTLTLLRCPSAGSPTTSQVFIEDTGLKATLDLEYLCSCDCEKVVVPSSASCSGKGSLSCGQCRCNQQHYGRYCECDGQSAQHDSYKCRRDNATTLTCSGRGECVCGRCECHTPSKEQVYQGDFCECSNFECPLHNNLLCSGHGTCDCNTCTCHAGWSGKMCSCSDAANNCVRPDYDSSQMCSGHGTCECNTCQCSFTGRGDEKYYGKWCHDCPTCGGECDTLSECVRCHLLAAGDKTLQEGELLCDPLPSQCADTEVLIQDVPESEREALSKCVIQQDNCKREFLYSKNSTETRVFVAEKWTCELEWWVLLLSVLGSVLLVGMVTLTVAFLVTAHRDKMAVIKMNEEAAASWNAARENDLYKNPVSQMQNPLYGMNQTN